MLTARALQLVQRGHYTNAHGLQISIGDEADLFTGLKDCARREGISLDALPMTKLRNIAAFAWRVGARQGDQP